MAGTHEGAQKAAATRKEKDPQAFEKMGSKGGSQSHSNQSGRREAQGDNNQRTAQGSGYRNEDKRSRDE